MKNDYGCDPRTDGVPVSNMQVPGVLGFDLGGGFGAGLGSGVGRVGGGMDPPILKVAVDGFGYPNAPQVWQPFAADLSTNAWSLDQYARQEPVDYGGVSGGPVDAMGFGPIAHRDDPPGLSREFGGLQKKGHAGGLLELLLGMFRLGGPAVVPSAGVDSHRTGGGNLL
jgi:hypothetical protein